MSLAVPAPRPRRRLERGPRAPPRDAQRARSTSSPSPGARPVELTDDRIVLAVESELLRQWIRQRYLTLLRDALFEVRGAGPGGRTSRSRPAGAGRRRRAGRGDAPRRPRAARRAVETRPAAAAHERPAAALHLRGLRHRALQPLRPGRGARRGRGAGARLQPVLRLRGRRASARPTCCTRSATSWRRTTRSSAHLRLGRDLHQRVHQRAARRGHPSFKDRYRSTDILLIDDIQSLQGREQTQEEFFHTFNALHDSGKQIVISSDRPPKAIATLEDRLRTRFEMGLITDVQPPGHRDAHRHPAEARPGRPLRDPRPRGAVVHRRARRPPTCARSRARSPGWSPTARSPAGRIDVELAREVLEDLFPAGEGRSPSTSSRARSAATTGSRIDELTGDKRTRRIVGPRQVAMYLSRELTDASLPAIGRAFGGRDHTTVMYAVQKVARPDGRRGRRAHRGRDADRPPHRPPAPGRARWTSTGDGAAPPLPTRPPRPPRRRRALGTAVE